MVLALVLLGVSLAAEGGLRRYFRLRADLHTLEQRNTHLAEENAKLRREVQALHDDPVAIERAAREELGLVRPGEVVITLETP
jgi:cell division protein FtsB